MNLFGTSILFVGLLLLGACERSPEAAKAELAAKNVAVTGQALLEQTKLAKAGESTARLLLDAGVDVNARQANGMTALMSAVFNGQHDVAQALLAKGADVNATAKGFTALRLAVERNDVKMVRLLVERGADPNLSAEGGASALDKAKAGGATEIVAVLEKARK